MKQVILFYVFAATSIICLNSCKKDTTNDKILINFINKTGEKIKSATANNTPIGNIENNEQTGFISFEKFGKDTQFPDCNFVGILNNDTLKSTSIFYWCGTEKAQLKGGKYNIEVRLYTYSTGKYIDLHFR
jgi:hypothetical protein